MQTSLEYGRTDDVIDTTLSHDIILILNYRGRIIPKRLNLRIEHVKHSKCREEFLNRVKENEKKKAEAKAKGIMVNCKRKVC